MNRQPRKDLEGFERPSTGVRPAGAERRRVVVPHATPERRPGEPGVEDDLVWKPHRFEAPRQLGWGRAASVDPQLRPDTEELVDCRHGQRAMPQRPAGGVDAMAERYDVHAGTGLCNSGCPVNDAPRLEIRCGKDRGDGSGGVRGAVLWERHPAQRSNAQAASANLGAGFSVVTTSRKSRALVIPTNAARAARASASA